MNAEWCIEEEEFYFDLGNNIGFPSRKISLVNNAKKVIIEQLGESGGYRTYEYIDLAVEGVKFKFWVEVETWPEAEFRRIGLGNELSKIGHFEHVPTAELAIVVNGIVQNITEAFEEYNGLREEFVFEIGTWERWKHLESFVENRRFI